MSGSSIANPPTGSNAPSNTKWLRKSSLVVGNDDTGLDLSELHFKFETNASDQQTPSTAFVRVYNLSTETANQIRKEFTRVVIQA
jgi:hypothetical protein